MATDLQFSKLPVSKRFAKKIGTDSIEVSGNIFDFGKQSNGYRIVIAAIYIPSARRTIFSAAACAPDDIFDMERALELCYQRGVSEVLYRMSGIKRADVSPLTAGSDYMHAGAEVTEESLYTIASRLVSEVAYRAERRALYKELQKVMQLHKTVPSNIIIACFYDALRDRKGPFKAVKSRIGSASGEV